MEIIFILILVAIAATAEHILYNKAGAKSLSYKAKLEKSEVFEGEEITLVEELSNGKLLPLPFVKTEIVSSVFLDFGVNAEVNKEGLCCIPSVFSLKGREKCRRVRNIRCTRRGAFELGASTLYGSDLFGLGGFAIPLSDTRSSLTVLPTPLLPEDFAPDNRQLYGDIAIRRFICEDPFLISGAHEYSGREPMNTIYWNGSARSGKLMAINRDYTTCAKMLILLSFQRNDEFCAPAQTEVCELMIKAAAYALEKAEEMSAEFALVLNLPQQPPISTGVGTDFKLIQLRRLAAAETDCLLTIGDFLREQPFAEFTDVVLITPYLSQETAEFLFTLKNRGQGVRVYARNNETDVDFCSLIIKPL